MNWEIIVDALGRLIPLFFLCLLNWFYVAIAGLYIQFLLKQRSERRARRLIDARRLFYESVKRYNQPYIKGARHRLFNEEIEQYQLSQMNGAIHFIGEPVDKPVFPEDQPNLVYYLNESGYHPYIDKPKPRIEDVGVFEYIKDEPYE
jgi:hypothetical protein